MKKRWKNRIAEGLALLLALSLLTGCGGSPAANTGDNAEKAANQETEQPAAEHQILQQLEQIEDNRHRKEIGAKGEYGVCFAHR